MLSGVNGASHWAADASESAGYLVETALGKYSSGLLAEWSPPDVLVLLRLLLGCLMPLKSGPMVALFWIRSQVYPPPVLGSTLISLRIAGVIVGGAMLIVFVQVVRFRLVEVSAPFLGLFSLCRELRCGRLLDGHLDTVRVSKVKGHADEGVVLDGQVREFDRSGNNAADEAADFGRRRVGNAAIDARSNLSGVCGRWSPVILDLHRFFVAISRVVVNHDGRDGTAPDPRVWSAGALPKRRRLVHAVPDGALLPGPPAIGESDWVIVLASAICAEDIAHWPYTTGLLVKWVSLVIFVQDTQFQCRLFHLVQALIFGALVVSLVL